MSWCSLCECVCVLCVLLEQAKAPSDDDEDDIQIIIKKPDGSTFTLAVNRYDSVHFVKRLIQEKEGIPRKQQRLIFNTIGMELDDAHTLTDYSVEDGSELNLVPSLVFVTAIAIGLRYTILYSNSILF